MKNVCECSCTHSLWLIPFSFTFRLFSDALNSDVVKFSEKQEVAFQNVGHTDVQTLSTLLNPAVTVLRPHRCVLVTIVSPAKTAELIEMPFGVWTLGAKGSMYYMWGPDSPGEGAILGTMRPSVGITLDLHVLTFVYKPSLLLLFFLYFISSVLTISISCMYICVLLLPH